MPKNSNDPGRTAANAAKHGAEARAKSIHHVTDFVTRSNNREADVAQVLTKVDGKSLDKAVGELTRPVPPQRLIQPAIFQQYLQNSMQHDRLAWGLLASTPTSDWVQNVAFNKLATQRFK